MKKFLIFLLIPLFSFSQEQLTEEMIIDHINEFFNALNIKNYNKTLLSQKVTMILLFMRWVTNLHLMSLQILLSLQDILDGSQQNGFFLILLSLLIIIQHMPAISMLEFSLSKSICTRDIIKRE